MLNNTKMEPGHLITLPFLGDRNYFHGSTLFDCLSDHIPNGKTISFKIPRMIHSDTIEISPYSKSAAKTAAAVLTWDDIENGNRVKSGFIANARKRSNSEEREAYDENRVWRISQITGTSVDIPGQSPYPFMTTAISGFKQLLMHCVEYHQVGQWVFTRYDGNVFAAFNNLTLDIARVIPDKIAEASVTVDGEQAGRIIFSWYAE